MPSFMINARLLQIYFRTQSASGKLDDKMLRRLTRECLALEYAKLTIKPVQGFKPKHFIFTQLYLYVLEYKSQFEVLMDIPLDVIIMNACFLRERHLMEDSNFVHLMNEIEQKYGTLRKKAIRLISRGNPQNPRPASESKKIFEETEAAIEGMNRDKKSISKYMTKIGFELPNKQNPETFFGPNIAKLVAWAKEVSVSSSFIDENEIQPSSELTSHDLFYSLYNYEELEKATTVLQGTYAISDRKGYSSLEKHIRYCGG